MPDVGEFLARWNRPGAPRRTARLLSSAEGNINTAGRPGIHEADDVDPGHPQWRAAIEEGVWPLVDTLTGGDWRIVTYDSCQGHDYSGRDLAPAWRRVGVLPRGPREYAAVRAALCRAVLAAVGNISPHLRVTLSTCDLTCGRTGRAHPVLDLGLEPAPGMSARYFTLVDEATTVLAACLREQRPAADGPCGCTPVRRPR
ncbi:hypothetical protein QQY24_06245 [Streptomyces sp. TG1A-8]|uniref:hypothetical protein n=1 Tax=Streptomyces sp. TG1A-8 TaxID=3051385 RepID=UPI00265BD275|nr:hypothetical protein [Streptomyces sp. TG1A-8]MDO0925036.1 hypothetical protein [Streptomyces sp. TG1A-8]